MALTVTQLQALKLDFDADPVLSIIPNTPDGNYEIAAAYNLAASPDFIVWRTQVSQDEIMQNGFDWVRVDNLSVGKARIWEWMFGNDAKSINPAKSNVRAGIDEVWKGVQADLNVRAAVYVHCKRVASRVEKLLSTGTGTDADPATMGYEGTITHSDVSSMRAL